MGKRTKRRNRSRKYDSCKSRSKPLPNAMPNLNVSFENMTPEVLESTFEATMNFLALFESWGVESREPFNLFFAYQAIAQYASSRLVSNGLPIKELHGLIDSHIQQCVVEVAQSETVH